MLNKHEVQLIVESISNKNSFAISVKPLSFKSAYYFYTSHIIIANDLINFKFKRNGQYYLQLWHGTPLKKINFDAQDTLSKRYLKVNQQNVKNIDFIISGSKYSTSCFKSAFRGVKEIKEIGTPRNDIFFEKNFLPKQIENNNVFNLLYAPTFRANKINNGIKQVDFLNPEAIIETLERKFQKKVVIMVKFHPNVLGGESVVFKNKKILNITGKISMEDALLKADFLITDYSSSFFDYALLKKPIILYAYDYASYVNERGFYLDLNELPIPIAYNQTELISIIERKAFNDYEIAADKLLDYIGNFETGNASKKLTDIIISIMENT